LLFFYTELQILHCYHSFVIDKVTIIPNAIRSESFKAKLSGFQSKV